MKQVLIATAFAASLLTLGAAQAAETNQAPAQQQAQQVQTQAQAQTGAVAVQPQSTNVAPSYEQPGRVNRAGSIYFGQ